MISAIKRRLLKAGPGSKALRLAFRIQAAAHGIRMNIADSRILLVRGRQQMVLGVRDMILVPFAICMWDQHFATIEGTERDGRTVLDFSEPALHRYRRSGLSFYFPSFPEDDCMDAYVAAYRPREGEIVWDVGAHAGTTSFFLSRMVGPRGNVYAFEPDETAYQFLKKNLEMHQVSNVTLVKAALAGKTGKATFCMDGTMCAGLSDVVQFASSKRMVEVDTLSLEDACKRLGAVPNFIKMDIEGAEVEAISGALEFLTHHPIHFAIESNHNVGGRLSSEPLDRMLAEAGYRAWSSDEYGQRFTWAMPQEQQRAQLRVA